MSETEIDLKGKECKEALKTLNSLLAKMNVRTL